MPIVNAGHRQRPCHPGVYAWARQQGSGRVMAVDGRHNGPSLLMTPTQVDVTVRARRSSTARSCWPVKRVDGEVGTLRATPDGSSGGGEPYPAGWVAFPFDIDEEFFKQLSPRAR